MLDPAGKSLYLQPWWYGGWSGLGPNAPIPLPITPPFQDASSNSGLPLPTALALREGHESCVWPPSPRQTRLRLPSARWRPAYGQLLLTVTRPLLHFRSRSEFCTLCSRGPGRALGRVMLLPLAGNWVSSWRAVCPCHVRCFLHRREMLDFCTSVCRIRTLSD